MVRKGLQHSALSLKAVYTFHIFSYHSFSRLNVSCLQLVARNLMEVCLTIYGHIKTAEQQTIIQ